MEVVLSTITGELFSRLISFLIKKHSDRPCVAEKLERLQNLLRRVHTVIEEAEGRYITNSRMMVQLRVLVGAMYYQGYYVLDAFKFKTIEEITAQDKVSNSCTALFSTAPGKRFHIAPCFKRKMVVHDELQSVLKKLEAAVSNMTEFVILLGGCKEMHKRPYGTCLYNDNFMFSSLAEKQQVINVMLQDNFSADAPAVIPVIGGYCVGKKSLVGYGCNDSMVRSHFSILHFSGDDFRIWKVNHETSMPVKTLVVIEFISDVDDSEWFKFYSTTTRMATGIKVIIISTTEQIARFGTVKPIRFNRLSHEEFVYLFKALTFESTDPENHPQLASVGMEIAEMLQGLLLTANVLTAEEHAV